MNKPTEKEIKQWMEDHATEYFEQPNGDNRLAEAVAFEFSLYDQDPREGSKVPGFVYELVEEVRLWWKDL